MKLKSLITTAVSVAIMIGTLVVPQVSVSASTFEKLYEAQNDTQDGIFQYHFAGGTDVYMSGSSETGRAYDAYLWIPSSIAPGSLKGLVAVKANLIEVPFVESVKLRNVLENEGFGILWLVFSKDLYGFNNTMNGFYTRKDYAGDATTYTSDNFTTDGKDASDIMNDILSGIALASGYSEIEDKTPLITIGHSAASPFGYRSGNWHPDRIIAQVHMKNGMSGNSHMVPGIPSLQYAAQYTEHDKGAGRDRSVVDARWHIANQRNADTNMLVSHIIEWGAGHYDWSDNATDMMIKYIEKAIDYRLPSDYNESGKLNDLTNSGYLMKPFEKDENGQERAAGYYQSQGGWLSSGKANSTASTDDKKASFWYFDEEFAKEVNAFTNYAIPPSPDSKTTKVDGATYSSIEPYMLMKDPSKSTYADIPAVAQELILPMIPFNADMSRYGSNRFVNYTRLANPSGDASNSAHLKGYDTATVDTYYMTNIPSITTNNNTTLAYDGAGVKANVPADVKAEFVPLMAPYEIVKSELVDMNGLTVDDTNSEAANVALVTRTTLRFHNNRVYYRAGNAKTNEYNSQLDSFGMILSPEITENGEVTSAFKVTAVQMNVPYTAKGTAQTLTFDTIPNVNIMDENAETTFDISYTSSDSDLQKYTDVFVEYGPARAIRTVNDEDGSYSWKIEILEDAIPENAEYPIAVNVVASNLGKWETTWGATAEQTFYITDTDTKSGVYLDGVSQASYDAAVNSASADDDSHTITIYSDSTTAQRSNMDSSENITFINGDFAAEVKQTSSNMMFLTTGDGTPELTFGKTNATATNKETALTFNANGKNRFAEINKGSLNVYNGVIITGGSAARGGGIDCKTGSALNMYGGIITGNTATNSDNTNLGGGGVSIVGYGTVNMYGGAITGNTSSGSYGGGVSVMENGTFNMSGGTISGNTGCDVYVKNNNMKLSGSARIGSLYLVADKTITVNSAFTTSGSHAEITPGSYTEGATVVTYANGVTPSTSDFTIAADSDGNAWYTYIDGQSLKLTTTTPYAITALNVSVQSTASKGETVLVTLPECYVDNSLVVSGINPTEFTKVSDKVFTFTMPENDITVSCLTNSDPSKIVVVGTNDTYYITNSNPMNVTFDVPSLPDGYVYKSAEVRVPVRANSWNAQNMQAAMNDESHNAEADISLTFTSINTGKPNTLTITNENSGGVDYYSYIGGWNGSKYDYPVKADNLSTLTLTKAVLAQATELTDADMSEATVNSDAKAWYVDGLEIPSWNPSLNWNITLNDGKMAITPITIPVVSGSGSISIGLVLYGINGDYTTANVESVTVVE